MILPVKRRSGRLTVLMVNPRIPITVFKVTGIGRFALLEKIHAKKELNTAEIEEYDRVKKRCEKICRTAFEKQVPIMIDAEETWIQGPIDELALEMMTSFNKEKIIVYNTYQMYRHDKLADLKADYLIAKETGFILGVKMVRGAYMEKERKRALEMGYPSPIQPDKAATDKDYNESLRFCVQHIDQIGFVCGTHNEDSSRLLTELMDENNIPHYDPHAFLHSYWA